MTVADWAPEQLAQAEADEIPRDGPFHRAPIRAERPAHSRHGRQVEVGRDGSEAHQRAQKSEHAPAVADRLGARRHDCDAIRSIAGEDRSGGDIGVHRGHSSWKIMLKLSPDRCQISGQWWREGAPDTVPPGP